MNKIGMGVHAQLSRGPPPCRRLPMVSGPHARTRRRGRALGGEDAAPLFQNMSNEQAQQFIQERETVAGLVVKVDVNGEEVKAVRAHVDTQVDRARADFKEDMNEVKLAMDRQFDKVDARFDKVDAQFDRTRADFKEDMNKVKVDMDTRFDKVDRQFVELRQDMKLLAAGMASLQASNEVESQGRTRLRRTLDAVLGATVLKILELLYGVVQWMLSRLP